MRYAVVSEQAGNNFSALRSIAFTPVFLMIGSFALADGAPTVDLDRPGALHQLEQQHPQRYRAVSALLRASEHAPCPGDEIGLLKTQFNVKDVKCGMIVIASYPARRHVTIELDGTSYAATVVLEDLTKLQRLSTAPRQPAAR